MWLSRNGSPQDLWSRGIVGLEVLDMKDFVEQSIVRVETTIGDLIEALTQVGLEAGKTPAESYEIASETLSDILHRTNRNLAETISSDE